MNVVTQLDEARQRHAEAVEKMEDWDAKYQALPEDHTAEEQEFFKNAFGTAKREAKRWADQVDRLDFEAENARVVEQPSRMIYAETIALDTALLAPPNIAAASTVVG